MKLFFSRSNFITLTNVASIYRTEGGPKQASLYVDLGTKHESFATSGTLHSWALMSEDQNTAINVSHDFVKISPKGSLENPVDWVKQVLDKLTNPPSLRGAVNLRAQIPRDLVMMTAFGLEGYGMPITGLDKNFDAQGRFTHWREAALMLQAAVGADRMLLILNSFEHQEASQFKEAFEGLNPADPLFYHQSSIQYKGGNCRIITEDKHKRIEHCFQAEDSPCLRIFPHLVSHRLETNFHRFTRVFREVSLAGLRVEGTSPISGAVEREMKDSWSEFTEWVPGDVLEAAKEKAKEECELQMSNIDTKNDMIASRFFKERNINIDDYSTQISQVTPDEMASWFKDAVRSRETFVRVD
ncbi:unnamed protein product [Moneuplotes crassus]|uniref:Uncharacterized protein n=1 Tax=Euplotes crassus TaxID=5936 RepID=A0AAD2CY32_EUPCR|nr:unnamed protein product [Moneuplotes crassus]